MHERWRAAIASYSSSCGSRALDQLIGDAVKRRDDDDDRRMRGRVENDRGDVPNSIGRRERRSAELEDSYRAAWNGL
jgi:hypothetical protein